MFDYEVVRLAIEKSSSESAVYVGCDSQRKKKKITYVTTIVIHHNGCNGATVFYAKQTERYIGFYPRLQGEIYKAAEVANVVKDMVGDRKFEVHLDLNPNDKFRSSKLVSEAKGAILGYIGVMPKFKPDAWAASHCSDRFTK